MKNITLTLLILFVFSLKLEAQIVEGFETDPPAGWTFMQTETDDPGFVQTNIQANSGTFSFYHNDDNIATSSTSWMISPMLSVASGDILEFYYRHNFSTWAEENGVWVSTASADPIANPGDFTLLYDLAGNPSEDVWTLFSQSLDAYVGQNIYIAFKYVGDFADELYIDDFYAGVPPACPDPTDLLVNNISPTGADISWTAGTETDWEVVIQPAGTGIPTGAGTAITNNPYSASGLSPATDYEVYVRANCLTDGFSEWVGPVNFTTACDVFVPDYLQDFTTIIPNCWDEASNGDATTGPTDIGTDGDWVADEYLNIGTTDGAYKINLWNTGTSDWIISPQFDLTTGGPFQVDFDFALMDYGSSTVAESLGSDDTVQLFISTDNGTTWTNLITFDNTTVVPASGTQIVYDLTAYSGQIVQFAMLGSEGTVDDSEDVDVFVDNFRVRAIPSCLEPTSVVVSNITDTSVDVSWVANSGETNWEIVVQPAGTGEPTNSGTAITTNPYTNNTLSASTAYEVYIRANCGSGYSVWVGPVNFTTLNTPPPPPNGVACSSGSSTFVFTEDFESDPPVSWTGTGFDGTNGNWDITVGDSNSGGTGPFASYSGSMHLEYEASGSATNIASAISPAIDLSTALDGAELSFYMHAYGGDMGILNVGVSTSATGPFTNVYTWIGDYQQSDTEDWVPVGINLDSYVGQVIYVEFNYGGSGTGFEGDMSIDFVRVETCGDFCVAPSALTVSNITGTSADISWTANSGETEWEYVVQPAGTGTPTGSGNSVTTTSVTDNSLSFTTDYEVYVRAICLSGTSVWFGPVNFTTPVQTDFVVDCSVGPVNFTYCYEDDDTNIFTFTSTDGTPLNLVFNAGQVEWNAFAGEPYDPLIVYNSDDTELYNGGGNTGNLSGLFFQSTGDNIAFTVQSDFIINCQSSNYTSIDVTVSCATCIIPSATYQVVDDCANGDQFLVDVNITDMGDASSLLISDNQGSTPVSVDATGITQFGPYPFLTDIIFTIENEQDINCVITSPAIQLAACPPDNDNPCDATVVTVNADESCDVTTPGTILEATPSGVPNTACGGNPDDDVWYQFTALGEQQIIQLTNIAGGTTNLDFALYEGTCDALTEIFCIDETAAITPQLTVGQDYYIRVFTNGSDSETSTFDLCVSTLGEPTYCTEALPICADASLEYPSVVGDQEAPFYLDYDCLFSQPDPQWNTIQFDVAGDYVFSLDQQNASGMGLDIDFIVWGPFVDQQSGCFDLLPEYQVDCSFSATASETVTITGAPANSTYVILITNYSQQEGTYTFSQDSGPTDGTNCDVVCDVTLDYDGNVIEDDVEAPGTADEVIDLCGYESVTLTASTAYSVDQYVWYVNGIELSGYNEPTLVATESATYQVQVLGGICDPSQPYFSALAEINFFQEAIATQPSNIEVCDDSSGDGFEAFDLESNTLEVLGDLSADDFVVTYHESLMDAQTATGALTSPYTNTTTTPQTIYVRVEDVDAVGSGSGCFATTSFDLVITGVTPTATSVDYPLCDVDNDGSEDFDLDSHSAFILDGQSDTDFIVTYYETEADADVGTSALTSPYTNTSSPQTIWARVENVSATSCYETTSFELQLLTTPEFTFSSDFEYEVCPEATIPVEIGIVPGNFVESEVSITWYYEGAEITGQNSTILPTVLLAGEYGAEVTVNYDGVPCSTYLTTIVEELESCVIPQAITPNNDLVNDDFDLSSYDVHSLEIYNRHGVLVYSKKNYVNEWHGQSDKGDELPVGTYFYVMKYRDNQVKTSWVYINR